MRTLKALFALSLISCATTACMIRAEKWAQQQTQVADTDKFKLDPAINAEPAPAAETSRIRVAVIPFQVDAAHGQRGEFEASYLASSLADTLAQSPWVADAYVSPLPTEAVEVTVQGEVLHSAPDGVEVRLVCRRGDTVLFSDEYGIRLTADDFDSDSSPVRRLWKRPTNQLGRALHESGTSSGFDLSGRVARYLDQPALEPSDRIVGLFEKAAEIEQVNLLEPVTRMVTRQVSELEGAYTAWQRDSIQAQTQAAQYRLEAARARKAAADIKKRANQTAAVGIGLSLLQGFARVQSGAQVNPLQVQADMQPFLNAAEEMEAEAQEAMMEADHLARRAEAAFATRAGFNQVFESNLTDLTVTLEEQVFTLVGAVDAQISQLRSIIRGLAMQEVEAVHPPAGDAANSLGLAGPVAAASPAALVGEEQ